MQILGATLTLAILIVSIIAHEVAHGYAAEALGDPTARLAGRLTLNPIAHIDLLGSIVIPALLVISGSPILFGWAKPVPYNPYNLRNKRWGEAIVAGAGVATNLFLAILFGLLARVALSAAWSGVAPVLELIAFINLFLGLFNLIPFPPLDGYGVLAGALPFSLSYSLRRFEARVRAYGPAALILFLLVFSFVLAAPFYNFVLWLFSLLIG
ncbi:MAG: site-2 protease family protein [Minisyncoccia bacterium]